MQEITDMDEVEEWAEQGQLTCSLGEAAKITGLSYDYLLGQSKIKNPQRRVPGFKAGKSRYAVIKAELPAWLKRMAGTS